MEPNIESTGSGEWHSVSSPDQSDWSVKRISAFQAAQRLGQQEPKAILTIPSSGIEAPVHADSAPMALEAGAALISGTAAPGEPGNMVIAGHRDGFFRPLEGIEIGSLIEVKTATGAWTYAVSRIDIVDALDLAPLDASDKPVLTLITCHPFRYKGYAPDRYIVRAELVSNL